MLAVAVGKRGQVFVGLLDTAASGERAPLWKRYGKYVPIFRRRPAASFVRFALALGRRAVWAAQWVRSGGKNPFVPQLAANRFFDSLNLGESLQPYSGPVTLFLARHGRGTDCALPDAGWGAFCGDSLIIVEIEGEHESILTSDVASLVRGLSSALAVARARLAGATSSESTNQIRSMG
jgi:thioesterase domain-containing protein